jgi:CRP-like cAMP-binding protein
MFLDTTDLNQPYHWLVTWNFGGSAFRELRHYAEELTFPANTIIFLAGDKPDGMYLVLEGVVLVLGSDESHTTARGETLDDIVRVIQEKQSFGELGLLTGTSRNATVKAGTDVRLLRITPRQLGQLEQEKPAVSTQVYKVLARTLAEQWMRGGEWVGRRTTAQQHGRG